MMTFFVIIMNAMHNHGVLYVYHGCIYNHHVLRIYHVSIYNHGVLRILLNFSSAFRAVFRLPRPNMHNRSVQ